MKVTNCKQFELLLAELGKKPSLAKGFQRGITPANFKESWEEITVILNSSGPPSRNSEGWQKVWRDLKCKVKRKLTHNKAEMNATGGGSNNLLVLTDLEEAVAALMNFDRQINPSGITVGFAVESGNVPDINVEEMQLEGRETSTLDTTVPSSNVQAIPDTVASSARTPRRRRQRANRNKENLLEKHSEMQEKVFKDISATLKDLKNYCKDNARYARKQYELAQRKAEREEELHEIDLTIKKRKLELLDRQLL